MNGFAVSLAVSLVSAGSAETPTASGGDAAGLPRRVLELRVAFREPGPGRRAHTVPKVSPPEQVYVVEQVVVSDADIRSVELSLNAEKRGVLIEFTAQGAKRLAAATRSHAGQHLAVFVDGVLHSAPYLQAPILDGRAWMHGGRYSDSELKDLERRLRDTLQR